MHLSQNIDITPKTKNVIIAKINNHPKTDKVVKKAIEGPYLFPTYIGIPISNAKLINKAKRTIKNPKNCPAPYLNIEAATYITPTAITHNKVIPKVVNNPVKNGTIKLCFVSTSFLATF